MEDREESVQHFLDLIKRSRRGKFKIYIGMIAGVGKSYRMLQEAHEMLENGVDVQIGYIETHGRAGTVAMLEGLPVISRKKIFYKGKEVEEMDLDAILQLHIYYSNPTTTNTIFNRFFYFRSEEIPRNDITYTDNEGNTTTIETCGGMSGLMTQDRYIEYMNEAFRNNKIPIQWTKG